MKRGASGIKIFKKSNWCFIKPKKKTDNHKEKDKKKIIIIWLVKAKPNGIKLNKLHSNTKINKPKTKGKKTTPDLPACCNKISKTNLNKNSQLNCQISGINLKSLKKNHKNTSKKNKTKKKGTKTLKKEKS